MHRVLRPGGGFAVIWNDWDDDDQLMRALNEIVKRLAAEPEIVDSWDEHPLAGSPLFGNREMRKFAHMRDGIDVGHGRGARRRR